jgi:hypothetical protein
MSHTDWRVLPHRPLEKVADNLWRVEGDLAGMPLKRVMAVVRTKDGRLVIHGAMALEETEMKKLEALGEPAAMLVPSGFHRMDAARFARRYPKMRVYCPHGARGRVASRVRLDGTYDDFEGDSSVRLEPVDGIGDAEGAMRVASEDGTTLVFNDILFNMPHPAGFGGVVTRVLGSSGGPRVSRTARIALLKDPRALARRFVALAATPGLVRVMVAHHETITDRPADALRQVALTL